MFGVGPVEMIVFLIILVVVIFLATRLLQGPGGTGEPGDPPTALEVLDQRYARGEINREEYLTIRDDIKRKQNA